MIYLLHGADTYRSRHKLKEIEEAYRKKAGNSLNFYRFDLEEQEVDWVKQSLETGSLFGAKKMAVIESAVNKTNSSEKFLSLLEYAKNSGDVFLVLWDGQVGADAKKWLEKIIVFCEKSHEFKNLEGKPLASWIEEEAKKRGVRLTMTEMSSLAEKENSWAIANELEKMSLVKPSGKYAESKESDIFQLGDAFFASPKQGFRHLFSLIKNGQEDFDIFSYLVNHLRKLIVLKSFEEEKKPVPASFGIHPYAAKKAAGFLKTISSRTLVEALRDFFEEDFKIKTGLLTPKDSIIRMLVRRAK